MQWSSLLHATSSLGLHSISRLPCLGNTSHPSVLGYPQDFRLLRTEPQPTFSPSHPENLGELLVRSQEGPELTILWGHGFTKVTLVPLSFCMLGVRYSLPPLPCSGPPYFPEPPSVRDPSPDPSPNCELHPATARRGRRGGGAPRGGRRGGGVARRGLAAAVAVARKDSEVRGARGSGWGRPGLRLWLLQRRPLSRALCLLGPPRSAVSASAVCPP